MLRKLRLRQKKTVFLYEKTGGKSDSSAVNQVTCKSYLPEALWRHDFIGNTKEISTALEILPFCLM